MRVDQALKWIEREVKKGRAFVLPAGSHYVANPMYSFKDRLAACRDIGELEGFANRRRFNATLIKWTPDQRDAIIRRKLEMENMN
jgi:hypothetical protein